MAAALSDESLGLMEYFRCERDPLYWIRRYGWIRDTRTGILTGPGLELWSGVEGHPGQLEFIAAVLRGDWVITGKARQIGVSWLLRNLEAWSLLFEPNVRLGIIAQGEDQAKEHLLRVQWICEQQPYWLRLRGPVPRYENTSRYGLAYGDGSGLSVLEAHPCTSRAARGISGKRIVAEEFAFWPSYSVWPGMVGATADSGGQIVIASTANGEGNKYHEIWRDAEKGTGAFRHMFFPWQTRPGRDAEWYDLTLKKQGSKALMQQEYPATPEEMFQAAGEAYFDRDLLLHLRSAADMKPVRTAYPEKRTAGQWITWQIFKEPQAGRRYVIGADVADGGGDACSADVLDIESGEQVACLNAMTWRAHEFADHLAELGRLYNNALLGVERNNSGLATLTVLQRERRYSRLYRQPIWDAAKQGEVREAGWLTDTHSRPRVFAGISRALQHLDLTIHSAETFRQLLAFQHNPRTKRPDAPDGDHDDAVFSLGIAQQIRLWAMEHAPRDIEIYHGDDKIA